MTWRPRASLLDLAERGSGLALMAFAGVHLFALAIGLAGPEAMINVEAFSAIAVRSTAGTVILAAAFLIHAASALAPLATRPLARLNSTDLIQVILGGAIVILLAPHVAATHLAQRALDVSTPTFLAMLAVRSIADRLGEVLLVAAIWLHGCIGLDRTIGGWAGFTRWRIRLGFAAVLLPLAAVAGTVVVGRELALGIGMPEGGEPVVDTAAAQATIASWQSAGWFAGVLTVLATAGACLVFQLLRNASKKVVVVYRGEPQMLVSPGTNLLSAIRDHRLPHAGVCGGRGRCSTCRVRIDQGIEKLAAPGMVEEAILRNIAAPANVRLACQVRVEAPLVVTRVLQVDRSEATDSEIEGEAEDNVERVLAVMFIDLRDFTQIMQRKMPYDIVYIVNEFYSAASREIERSHGQIDKFTGDGLLAVFGHVEGPEVGCKQALLAARGIDLALDHLNARLAADLDKPLSVGMGIHVGRLIVCRVGSGKFADRTVIGHTVNAASRLEPLTKTRQCQIIISSEVANYAGLPVPDGGEKISVRGIEQPISIVAIARGRDLPVELLSTLWT